MPNPTTITLRAFDATPENVILHPVNSLDIEPLVTVLLNRYDVAPTYPATSNVASGVKYGPTGVELVGTLSGGGGMATGAILIDVKSLRKYIFLAEPLIYCIDN